jgi:hypothetical protein
MQSSTLLNRGFPSMSEQNLLPDDETRPAKAGTQTGKDGSVARWLKEFAASSRPLWIALSAAGIGFFAYYVYMMGVQHGLKNLDSHEMIKMQREVEDMERPPAEPFPAAGTPGFPGYSEPDHRDSDLPD